VKDQEANMTILPAAKTMTRIALAGGIAAAALTAAAVAQQAKDLMPQAGELRLTLSMGNRTVAFPAKMTPIARESIPFEAGGHAVTPEGRQAMIQLQEALFRQPGGSLILVVYGENEALAYQRAKAVRGELAERHSMDPARIIASGRKAQGHAGDLAVVDVYSADPTRCGGCGTSNFRTIALDSATMSLVTATAEALPTATATSAPKPAPPPRTAAAPARPTVIAAPATAPAPTQVFATVSAPQATPGACPRPKIIIDDYYPGGPIVPCRPNR
jgi:hypothetical protein